MPHPNITLFHIPISHFPFTSGESFSNCDATSGGDICNPTGNSLSPESHPETYYRCFSYQLFQPAFPRSQSLTQKLICYYFFRKYNPKKVREMK